MNLRITDGTTTVNLNSTSPVLGATYFPQPPELDEGGFAQDVTETAEVTLEGTASNIRSTVTSVERLLELARVRQRTRMGPRVYVEYQAVDGDDYYRSEILNGRATWSANPGARRLSDTTPKVQVGFTWQRRGWWEGALTQLQLTSSANGTPTTGYVTLYNKDDATASETNWIGIAAAQVAGSLPAPLKLELVQNDATARAWREIYLANNVFADPANMDPFLLGSEATGGATANWTGASTHATRRFTWELSTTLLADTAGRYFRILVAPASSITANTYVKAWVVAYVGSTYQVLWEGDEVLSSGSEILDLGSMPLPPGGYDTERTNIALQLSVRNAGSGSMEVDFVQLTPADWGQYRQVVQLGYSTSQNDALIDDGIEELTYYYDAAAGKHFSVMRPLGMPLHVWPNQTQRLRVLINGGGGFAPSWTMKAKAWYRPRVMSI